jgi:hypothetical protein
MEKLLRKVGVTPRGSPLNLIKKANDPENPNLSEDEEDWYESFSEWEHHLVELCDDELMIVMTEYPKHLAYMKRCEKKGTIPKSFISSV